MMEIWSFFEQPQNQPSTQLNLFVFFTPNVETSIHNPAQIKNTRNPSFPKTHQNTTQNNFDFGLPKPIPISNHAQKQKKKKKEAVKFVPFGCQ